MARRAGQAKSKAKATAARANGAKGGPTAKDGVGADEQSSSEVESD